MEENKEIKEILREKGYILLEEFKSFNRKYEIIDIEGYKYKASIRSLVQKGSPLKRFIHYNPYTIENVNHYLESVGSNTRCIDEEWFGDNNKTMFKCGKCGKLFKGYFSHMRKKRYYNCKECNVLEGNLKHRIDQSTVEKTFLKNGLILDEEYTVCSQHLMCHDELGYKYSLRYHDVKRKCGFYKRFYPSNPFTIDNIKNYIKINHLNVELLATEYINNSTKMPFRCSCGEIFYTTLANFFSGKTTCGKCSESMSRFEVVVKDYFDAEHVDYEYEIGFDDCRSLHRLRFDFGIFKNDSLVMLLELDGLQHNSPQRFGGMSHEKANENLETQKERDQIKNDYCESHNIPLVRIPYTRFKNGKYTEDLERIIDSL